MSTSRYTNAGNPGVGVTLLNMPSRIIAWAQWSYAGGVPSAYQTLSISSFTDYGVGITRPVHTVSTQGVGSGTVCGFCWHSYGNPQANGIQVYTYDFAGVSAPQDAPNTVVQVTGYLA